MNLTVEIQGLDRATITRTFHPADGDTRTWAAVGIDGANQLVRIYANAQTVDAVRELAVELILAADAVTNELAAEAGR